MSITVKNNNTITVHIRHLREKMNDSVENPKYIKTVWGVGYKIRKNKNPYSVLTRKIAVRTFIMLIAAILTVAVIRSAGQGHIGNAITEIIAMVRGISWGEGQRYILFLYKAEFRGDYNTDCTSYIFWPLYNFLPLVYKIF